MVGRSRLLLCQRLSALLVFTTFAACSEHNSPKPDETPRQQTQKRKISGSEEPTSPNNSSAKLQDEQSLSPKGFDVLRFGQPVAANSAWKTEDSPMDFDCQIFSNPQWPHIYAIVEHGVVQRISLETGSTIGLPNGLRPGSTEAAVRAAYPNLIEEAHAYSEPPAKYLTSSQPNRKSAGIMFEIGEDRTVEVLHVGLNPVLGYVEGCS